MEDKYSEEMWAIVKARVSSMSSNLRLSIGGAGTLSKEELIKHVEKRDEIGQLLIRAHQNYIRSFKQEAKAMFS